MIIHTIMPFCN